MELRRIRRKFPVSSPPVKEEPNSDLDVEYDVVSIICHTYVDGRLFMLIKGVSKISLAPRLLPNIGRRPVLWMVSFSGVIHYIFTNYYPFLHVQTLR